MKDLCTICTSPDSIVYRHPTTPALVRVGQVRVGLVGFGLVWFGLVWVGQAGVGGAASNSIPALRQTRPGWHQIRQNNRAVPSGLVGILEDGLPPGEIHLGRAATVRANESEALRR
jgi:hypothetical protein